MSERSIRVLLIDPDPGSAGRVESLLSNGVPWRFAVTPAAGLPEGISWLARSGFDAIVVEPAANGRPALEMLAQVRLQAPVAPTIVLSAVTDCGAALEAIQNGAQDYLIKGQVDGPFLARAIRFAIARQFLAQRLSELATTDALTGLPNRSLFTDRLAQALSRAPWSKRQTALVFLDLDRFKRINDSLGHPAGDLLLREVARRLRVCVREGDTVARFGGDEFAIILADLADARDVTRIVPKVMETLARPVTLEGHQISITASLGISLYPADGHDVPTLLKNADTAMYRAKEEGRNGFRFYRPAQDARASERLALERALRAALDHGEFMLHYQPRIDIGDRQVVGVEALLRWRRPGFGLLPPADFMPLAEDTGLVVPIGEWALRTAWAQARAWHAGGFDALAVGVNLSARQFEHHALVETVEALLRADSGPTGLELELTEGTLMRNVQVSLPLAERLHGLGLGLSVDDFGTGFSSLSCLSRYPINALKIDASLVRDLPTDTAVAALVSGIVQLAHSLNLKVVAEAVETEAQLDFLRQQGCDQMQGFVFSAALPPDQVPALVRRHAG